MNTYNIIINEKGNIIRRQVKKQGEYLYTTIGGVLWIVIFDHEYPSWKNSLSTNKVYRLVRIATII